MEWPTLGSRTAKEQEHFTGRVPFLPLNQQRPSTEGCIVDHTNDTFSLVGFIQIYDYFTFVAFLWLMP